MRRRLVPFGASAKPEAARRPWRALAALGLALALPGCSTFDSVGRALGGGPQAQPGDPGFVRGFLGAVAGEEPRAVVIAREVLAVGGSAADAAVAAGFMMTVTLPSRAGLGGGGACLLFEPRRGDVEAILFPPGPRQGAPAGADRPAAVPMMARGLFTLYARAGRRPFETLVVPAEQAARLGTEVSRALATDLAAVSGPLLADPWSAAVFGRPGGGVLGVGDRMTQPDLGATLSVLRTGGVGELYQGTLARRLAEASVPAGGNLDVAEMRASVPRMVQPLRVQAGSDLVSFLPQAADGGLAAAAFRGEAASPGGALPASAGLTVVDRDGQAVSCVFTMNNLFGTGRIAPATGVLLAAAPDLGQVRQPPLSAAIAHNQNLRSFRAAVAGSGQEAAPAAVAAPLAALLRGADATSAAGTAPDAARSQVISCPRYLPGSGDGCTAASDARGSGLALGGER
jgi:gamma-glutamyltranspeptidase/glutathione hydrolase